MERTRAFVGVACVVLVALMGLPSAAQDHGDGGCGDVFGDLIHVLRDVETGQPILAQRWVELPAEVPGYGWGYCPIALDALGNEIGFLPFSCDVTDPTAVEEVDYFGRLNAGRTKEKNSRMHFNEVISTIKSAGFVMQDPAGRLRLGFNCAPNAGGQTVCAEWSEIDSPMENLGLYTRLMKYGHIQTDPFEVDPWFHGDPALPVQYQVALGPEDWPKFHNSVRHLLPGDGAASCFALLGFDPACAAPEALDDRDFVRAGSFLGGAANKTGEITVDLVQYMNRVLKIPVATAHTAANPNTFGALVRDCWPSATDPESPAEDDPAPQDPPYLPPAECTIVEADPLLPGYDLFFEVQERFVDYHASAYWRPEWREETAELIMPVTADLWQRTPEVSLLGWLAFSNGPPVLSENLESFVGAASDAVRSIELIHNFAVPEDLGYPP